MFASPNASAARSLCLVPDRVVPRAKHLPAGRSLHLVDIENLAGAAREYRCSAGEALAQYRALAGVRAGDHVVIAAGGLMAFRAGHLWAGARVVAARGLNGADLALINEVGDPEAVAARFDRVVIGSGDGIFVESITALRRLGIPVGVVAPIGGLSAHSYRAASFVRVMMPELSLQGAA
jgi:hypothetical protein